MFKPHLACLNCCLVYAFAAVAIGKVHSCTLHSSYKGSDNSMLLGNVAQNNFFHHYVIDLVRRSIIEDTLRQAKVAGYLDSSLKSTLIMPAMDCIKQFVNWTGLSKSASVQAAKFVRKVVSLRDQAARSSSSRKVNIPGHPKPITPFATPTDSPIRQLSKAINHTLPVNVYNSLSHLVFVDNLALYYVALTKRKGEHASSKAALARLGLAWTGVD